MCSSDLLALCRTILGPNQGTVVYGWVFAAHQVGGSIAAFGAAVIRVKFGDYAQAFYISGALCLVAALVVLRIAKGMNAEQIRNL